MMGELTRWMSSWLYRRRPKTTHETELVERISSQLNRRKAFKLNPHTPLKEVKFIIFDTETTGFYPDHGDELISIGAVALQNGKLIKDDIFHEWINPGRSIPSFIMELTHLKTDDIENASSVLEVLDRFLQYASVQPLVAHCADFDLGFINRTLRLSTRQTLKNNVIDTQKLGFYLQPYDGLVSLDELLKRYDITIGERHHALSDAQMTAQLLVQILAELEAKKISTIDELFYYMKNAERYHSMALF